MLDGGTGAKTCWMVEPEPKHVRWWNRSLNMLDGGTGA